MLKIFQVDAFTSRLFGGNPAAVVMLEQWVDDALLQSIAAENNLAETAYLVPLDQGWELRWFTPTAEVALCGHATLAAAHVLVTQLGCNDDVLKFETRQSGTLTVKREASDILAMTFPAIPIVECGDANGIEAALGAKPDRVMVGRYSKDQKDFVAVFEDEAIIADLNPRFFKFKQLDSRGIIATAKGTTCDFVSRYFAPNFGIDEDPVTGSAHCLLTPYWSEKLGKQQMEARQISHRGGELLCGIDHDRIVLKGRAVNYMVGTLLTGGLERG